MRFRRLMSVMSCCVLAGCWAAEVAAQDFPAPEVTAEHKRLQKDVGVWDAEMKLWPGGPDSEPMVAKGTERNRMIGQRWLISTYTGELGGQEFTGHGITGYDPAKKKFIGTWVDSMSTQLSPIEGTYDEATGELTMVMTSVNPETNEEMKSKMVTKYTDPQTRLFTMYMSQPGSDAWVKSMEITYKRQAREGKGKRKR